MKAKTKNAAGLHQNLCEYLNKYGYVPEMKADGSVFEKRKIESAAFNAEKSQLNIKGSGPDFQMYSMILKNQRKVYSRTDREYDKIIIKGYISVGEDFSTSERQKLIIYLKGYPGNAHISLKLRNGLSKLIEESKKEPA